MACLCVTSRGSWASRISASTRSSGASSERDVITVWTTPVNYGKQTRYNFAGTVPPHTRVRLIDHGDQIMFTFDNPTNAAVPVDNHTYVTDVGAELHDRYRLDVVHGTVSRSDNADSVTAPK